MILSGTLTEDQIARIVGLCELAGKINGVSSYIALADILTALGEFKPQLEKEAEPENQS